MASQTIDLAEDRQNEVLIVAWVTTGAAFVTVAFKIFTRFQVVRIIGWDDFFVVFSMRVCFGVPQYGEKHLFTSAKYQMMGYPFNIGET
ncbi:hypothetical protein N0V86_009842 [Didymella sp. IMI 355093]|nr:hypothetical protein N0V86_009842 [Didymella sp. IMI 355093]